MLSVPEAGSVQNSTAVASYTNFLSRILGGNLVKRTVATVNCLRESTQNSLLAT